MKNLFATFMFVCAAFAANAQTKPDFSNPAFAKWGATPEQREKNVYAGNDLRTNLMSKNYEAAAGNFKYLVDNCPAASETIYQRGALIYKAKIKAAEDAGDIDKKMQMVDSLMIVYDLRIENFGGPKSSEVQRLKAIDFIKYNNSDREGLREVLRSAVDANAPAVDSELLSWYFDNLVVDYQMDLIMPEDVKDEFYRLKPMVEALPADQAEVKDRFENKYISTGIATCDEIETLYKDKIAASPTDAKLLAKVTGLLDRADCINAFYETTAEQLYKLQPNSESAMILAALFQNKQEYDKALKYLRDALAAENDAEEKEALYARIALVELAASRMNAAYSAAKSSLATVDGTTSDNGIAYFVMAQAYAAAALDAAKAGSFDGQALYWLAYDTIQKALKSFTEDEKRYVSPARQMATAYRNNFPNKEECHMRDLADGAAYTVEFQSVAKGMKTTVRTRD